MAVVTEWRDRQRRGRAKSEFTLEAEADVAGGLVGWQPFDGADGEADAAAAFAGVYYHYYTLQAERADLLFEDRGGHKPGANLARDRSDADAGQRRQNKRQKASATAARNEPEQGWNGGCDRQELPARLV